jgi:starch phosphorylase
MDTPGTPYLLHVRPRLPARLERLAELANNLRYTWDRETRSLFSRLNPRLWSAAGHNPRAFLKRIDETRLREAVQDAEFMASYSRMLAAYDVYLGDRTRREAAASLGDGELVAYFCAEFGFHESLPIYSGGLGILAGDHCKAASDLRLPFVAVGLLYRQGYFLQTIDPEGNQHATYNDSDFDDLPVEPVRDAGGTELRVAVELPGRALRLKVWQSRIGHVTLYLLDTDLPENSERDRLITYRLYGGDRTTRVQQEIALGIGGVRALAAAGVRPTIWHINEGHAAFLILERIRGIVQSGAEFDAALEAVAANTVFTTHTAVAAGHDYFSDETMAAYFDAFCKDLGIGREKLLALGREPGGHEFNMTALAARGARYHNGVSNIHGGVSARLLAALWPQIPPQENPVTCVTNGVHVPTFLAREWADVYDRFLGDGWFQHLSDPDFWAHCGELPDEIFWNTHQTLKSQLLYLVRYSISQQHLRDKGSKSHLDRLLRLVDPANLNVLTIGFGRRFATYKRATLLFENIEWLQEIVSVRNRPVLFLYAGKAHPADGPGQDLIRHITRTARSPEFEGKILLVEAYDMRLARRMVSGVDVWLNNPIYPLEASGTSGMKAGINGVLNLSVLDGWWGEAYHSDIGWAIKPASEALDQHRRNQEEGRTLYELLQDQVVPLYYERGENGLPERWIRMAKRSIAAVMQRFNASRMVNEYTSKFYLPAARQRVQFEADGYRGARQLADWKRRVRAAWPGVTMRRIDAPVTRALFGERLRLEVAMRLNGLAREDLRVELRLARAEREGGDGVWRSTLFTAEGTLAESGEQRFVLELAPEFCGRLDYRIRAYPYHELLTHPFETGLMLWA